MKTVFLISSTLIFSYWRYTED